MRNMLRVITLTGVFLVVVFCSYMLIPAQALPFIRTAIAYDTTGPVFTSPDSEWAGRDNQGNIYEEEAAPGTNKVGETVYVRWNSVSGADHYHVVVKVLSGSPNPNNNNESSIAMVLNNENQSRSTRYVKVPLESSYANRWIKAAVAAYYNDTDRTAYSYLYFKAGEEDELSLGVDEAYAPIEGGDGSKIRVRSNTSWTVKGSSSWISFDGTSGSGDGYIYPEYSANTGTSRRTGTITVTTAGGLKKTVSVTQYAKKKPSITSPKNEWAGTDAEGVVYTVDATPGTNKIGSVVNIAWGSVNYAERYHVVAKILSGSPNPSNNEEPSLSTPINNQNHPTSDRSVKLDLTSSSPSQYIGKWVKVAVAAVYPSGEHGGYKYTYFQIGDAEQATVQVTGVKLDKTTLTMKTGESARLTATVTPDNATDKRVTFKTSNASVAAVNASTGEVTAVSEGEAVITATTTDGKFEAMCLVTVTKGTVIVTGIELDKPMLSLKVGAAKNIVATVKPDNATDKRVTFVSSNESVARVGSMSGEVIGVGEGKATITATTVVGSYQATCEVIVRPADSTDPAKISVSYGQSTLYIGKTYKPTVSITPSDTVVDIMWTSSNPAIATVDNSGVVTPLKSGSVKITAFATDDVSASVSLLVKMPSVTGIYMDKSGTVKLSKGEYLTIYIDIIPAEASEGATVSYKTSKKKVIGIVSSGIDSSGKHYVQVRAKKKGTATITATCNGYKAKVKIKGVK